MLVAPSPRVPNLAAVDLRGPDLTRACLAYGARRRSYAPQYVLSTEPDFKEPKLKLYCNSNG